MHEQCECRSTRRRRRRPTARPVNPKSTHSTPVEPVTSPSRDKLSATVLSSAVNSQRRHNPAAAVLQTCYRLPTEATRTFHVVHTHSAIDGCGGWLNILTSRKTQSRWNRFNLCLRHHADTIQQTTSSAKQTQRRLFIRPANDRTGPTVQIKVLNSVLLFIQF